VEVRLRENGDTVELSVCDTGTGIPADELPHIFERFHRVKGARGRTIEGSGIGLSLVRELARLHGGDVRVASELNRGTTFTVTIASRTPRSTAESAGASRARVSTALDADGYVREALRWLPGPETGKPAAQRVVPRILLADDNADMRE